MSLTDFSELKLRYQNLSDQDKFIQFAHDYGNARYVNRYKSSESYWMEPGKTDGNFMDIYEYYFPLFYQTQREFERIFEFGKFPEPKLFALICATTAYKNMPHVMFLWERRRYYGLEDYTLNTHELLGIGVNSAQAPEPSNGVPDSLRYSIT